MVAAGGGGGGGGSEQWQQLEAADSRSHNCGNSIYETRDVCIDRAPAQVQVQWPQVHVDCGQEPFAAFTSFKKMQFYEC